MRWFKHMSASWDEEKLSLVVDEHGLAGYGFWWRLVEIVAAQMDETHRACAFSEKKWSKMFGVYPKVFIKFCKTLQKHSLIILKTSENISETSENVLEIEIPILLKLKDNHSRNLQAKNRIRIDKDKEVELTPPCIPPVRGDAINHPQTQAVDNFPPAAERMPDAERKAAPPEASAPEKPEPVKRGDPSRKTPLPDDFGVSDAVREWAMKHGYGQLEERLEAFILAVKSKGYKYVDWDAAFKNSIRCDWARIDSRRSSWPPVDRMPAYMDVSKQDYGDQTVIRL